MRYDHMIKAGGEYYEAGKEVPNISEGGAVNAPSSQSIEEEPLPFTPEKEATYTKTDINRMSADDLRKLASEMGVDGADGISGAELKKILIEKLGL